MSAKQVALADAVGADIVRAGLIGREILASRSPWMHEEEARALALKMTYQLFDFTDRGWDDTRLAALLDQLQNQGFSGVNITHPFKQMVIEALDSLAPSARSVGAVNTIRFEAGRKTGYNTDVTGFAESVRQGLGGARIEKVVQFGAGGAGSATACALLSLGVRELTLVDSNVVRAEALAASLAAAVSGAQVKVCRPDLVDLIDADGVVNATPIGMAAHPGCPFDPALLHPRLWVADIVYFPLETELLYQARVRGCRTLDGKGMAVFQAADAFDIFTGASANRARMLESFDAFVDDGAV